MQQAQAKIQKATDFVFGFNVGDQVRHKRHGLSVIEEINYSPLPPHLPATMKCKSITYGTTNTCTIDAWEPISISNVNGNFLVPVTDAITHKRSYTWVSAAYYKAARS